MPRLFSGIELPEDIKDQLSDLEVPLPGAFWIEEDNLHITLRFAGDIDNRLANEFAEELSRIDVDVFELALEGVHVLGGNDPKILYAGLRASPQLEALARAHERAARSVGLSPETRPFKPHITLARLRNVVIPDLTRFLQAHALLRSRPFYDRRIRAVFFTAQDRRRPLRHRGSLLPARCPSRLRRSRRVTHRPAPPIN